MQYFNLDFVKMSLIKKLRALRGAVCCEDNEAGISSAVVNLYSRILTENSLSEKDIVSIQFTVTSDIRALNPASALRKNGFAKNRIVVAAENTDGNRHGRRCKQCDAQQPTLFFGAAVF